MKKIATWIAQAAIVALGAGILAFLLWEPQIEGVNAHATLFEIYFNPFVLFAYGASIPFFVGLWQAFRLVGYAGQGKAVSPEALKALRTLRYCALALLGLVAASVAFMISADPEDRPAGTFTRLLIALPATFVAIATTTLERILQNTLNPNLPAPVPAPRGQG